MSRRQNIVKRAIVTNFGAAAFGAGIGAIVGTFVFPVIGTAIGAGIGAAASLIIRQVAHVGRILYVRHITQNLNKNYASLGRDIISGDINKQAIKQLVVPSTILIITKIFFIFIFF